MQNIRQCRQLREIVDGIYVQVAKIEDDLKILQKLLHEDNEYALYSVTLFSHDAENLEPRNISCCIECGTIFKSTIGKQLSIWKKALSNDMSDCYVNKILDIECNPTMQELEAGA
ncbi:Uncharacterized protein Adt_00626 [Abeliophyllum distichum]|uniref:Uncharacterized protein n=1 Tax=Abeliophyllum distichum TaxID=126358 RepID=A0ABD1VSE5_9LAMI